MPLLALCLILAGFSLFAQPNEGENQPAEKENTTVEGENASKPGETGETTEADDLDEDPFGDEEIGAETKKASDPLEGMNRAFHTFNDFTFTYFFNPLATGYAFVTPRFLRKGISNVFENLKMPMRLVSTLGQGRLKKSGKVLSRFTINSTVGLAGLIEVAEPMTGWERVNEDMGQMFGYWGIGQGPYVVLPFFGPSGARDSVGLIFDLALNPVTYVPTLATDNYVESFAITAGIYTFTTVNNVSLQLGEYENLKKNSLDHYVFFRDVYIQYREKQVEE